MFLNTFQHGVIMILHYSDEEEAMIAPICIPHEKKKKNPKKLLKNIQVTLKKFNKTALLCKFKTRLLHEQQIKT